LILDEESASLLDKQRGTYKPKPQREGKKGGRGFGNFDDEKTASMKSIWPADNGGGVSRFFYCAKSSSKERNEGLDGFPEKMMDVDGEKRNQAGCNSADRKPMLPRKNPHPTVKPLSLMRYLITLIAPPKDAVILDPFAGSGSTIVAAKQLGIDAIGIEKCAEYCEIANARVKAA